jgi:hypothetical protein
VLLAPLLLLTFATPALANSIAPTAYFWPGVLPLTLGLALPASVLAAFLERPFVSQAGVREHAAWYSLQANLVSLVIGYLTLPFGVYALYTIGPLWSVMAVCMSIVAEGWYYRRRATKGSEFRWGPVVWGNLFSSFVLLVLPYVALAMKEADAGLVWQLDPYQDALFWVSVSASILVFHTSFILPGLLRRLKAVAPESLHLAGPAVPASLELKAVEVAPAGEQCR